MREQLAALSHEQWSQWMEYLFARCEMQPDGSAAIPAALVERWTRQMKTLYDDLPEAEKESDRREADRVLQIVAPRS